MKEVECKMQELCDYLYSELGVEGELEGFADDSFVTIERDNSLIEEQETSDGGEESPSNSEQTYQVTLAMNSLSDLNSTLADLYIVNEVAGQSKFPLIIKDNLGSSLFSSESTWLSKKKDHV